MPKKMLDLHRAGKKIQQKAIFVNEFGQTREELQLDNGSDEIMDLNITYKVKKCFLYNT